jgi:hypothetical protein
MKPHQPLENYPLEVCPASHLRGAQAYRHAFMCLLCFPTPKQESVEGLKRSLSCIRMGAEFISTIGAQDC